MTAHPDDAQLCAWATSAPYSRERTAAVIARWARTQDRFAFVPSQATLGADDVPAGTFGKALSLLAQLGVLERSKRDWLVVTDPMP